MLPIARVRGATRSTLAIGTTAVFLDDQLGLLQHWKTQLDAATGYDIRFVQRGSYQEITDLLLSEQIDAAWICGYPYVANWPRFRLIAVPVYQGKPLYRSHLIVPKSDTTTDHITKLRGKVFAFSDPNSNSGFLVPRVEMVRANLQPETFFRKVFFTYAHRRVIDAVVSGLAEGGSIDGYVWDTVEKQHPELTAGARVAWRSPLHGHPPIVARPGLPMERFNALQHAFTTMPTTAAGREMLRQLNLDGFTAAGDHTFDTIRELLEIYKAAA